MNPPGHTGRLLVSFLVAVLASTGAFAVPQTVPQADALAERQAHRTGAYRIALAGMDPQRFVLVARRVQRRFKESARIDRAALMPWTDERKVERWRVRVPDDYDPNVPHGVVVYVSDDDEGDPPVEAWAEVLDRRRLIWIAPERVGGLIRPHWRIAKSIEAVALIRQRYAINDDRRYVAGFSSGGQVASSIAINFPDFFSGALYLSGCDPLQASHLAADRYLNAARENRYALLAGEQDQARQRTRHVVEQYQQARFASVAYLELPDHGHEPPPADAFDQALAALDAPLAVKAERAYRRAARHDEAGRLGLAVAQYAASLQAGFDAGFMPAAEARRRALLAAYDEAVATVEKHIEAGAFEAARQALGELRKAWMPYSREDVERLAGEMVEARRDRRGG